MPEYLDDLNEPQRRAALHLEGPLLVHAPVGTGKTTVLAHRAAQAILAGRPAGSLLCLSFTNRAARQMRERITNLLGGRGGEIAVRTFHGFCTQVLRMEADTLGLPADFTICDEADSRDLLLDAWRQQRTGSEPPDKLGDVLSRFAQRLKHPGAKPVDDSDELLQDIAEESGVSELSSLKGLNPSQLIDDYNAHLAANGSLDFADLIARVRRLFDEEPERLYYWQQLYPWIQVDEIQDTTPAEYHILARLAEHSWNLAFFGDLDQTIYEWRGSMPWELMKQFTRRFHPVHQIELKRNYRSSRHILSACLSLILAGDRSVTKEIECASGAEGKKVFLHAADNPEDEAHWIAKAITQLRTKHGVERRQIALLVRTNQQAAELSGLLAREKVDHFLVDRVPFFRQTEIKDALALVRVLLNPLDGDSLRRVLGRGTFGIAPELIDEVRRLRSEVGLRLVDLIEPLTPIELDPFGLLLRRLNESRVVLFDTETTGLDTSRDEVVELAALRVGSGGEVASFHALLRTERPMDEASRVHGITPEMLEGEGRDPHEIFAAFRSFIADCVLVGHNVGYDVHIVQSQMRRLGFSWPNDIPTFDTLEMTRRFFNLPRYSLTALCHSLGLDAAPSHRAMDDVRATWKLLRRLVPYLLKSRPIRQRVAARFAPAFRETAEKFTRWRQLLETERPIVLLDRALDESGLRTYHQKRPARLHELSRLFGQYDDPTLSPRESLVSLANLAALGNEVDRCVDNEDKVLLLTAHQAKGLEFDTVFIAGATDRQFPSQRSLREGRAEEERRLFYVAMTRARYRLIMSYSATDGSGRSQVPSRFLACLPAETCLDLSATV